MTSHRLYVDVILPLRLKGTLSYYVPDEWISMVYEGSWVIVTLVGRKYLSVVQSVSIHPPDFDPKKIKGIVSVVDLPPVKRDEMNFWRKIADYYMCSVGEVFKAAYSQSFQKQVEKVERSKAKKALASTDSIKKEGEETEKSACRMAETDTEGSSSQDAWLPDLPELSSFQHSALQEIKGYFKKSENVLLNGVTGSGKTEIYMHLAAEALQSGGSVLFMVPEIAISRQLYSRLQKVFGERLLLFHSKQTAVRKKKVFDTLITTDIEQHEGCSRAIATGSDTDNVNTSGSGRPDVKRRDGNKGYIVLGTRSAVFLPFSDLKLVIVDEEHDSSYKQSEPAPRYNGRDAALMLAAGFKANVILGSATPSLESQYNVHTHKLEQVLLSHKYHANIEPQIKIIDTVKARKLHNMKGSFTMELINEMRRTLDRGEQIMVFRSRRAYSPIVQCQQCGAIPKCPHCNVSLSYHKFSNSLECHYCNYKRTFSAICPECNELSIVAKGAGTEKIEEELAEYFRDAVVARFDAETTESKVREQKILKDFAAGRINILVGTQMITKGFDFENLTLAVVINADSLFAVQDFRADERALQLLQQLRGRAGRREKRGTIIIQTAQPERPILQSLLTGINTQESSMKEREMFGYPPFVRLMLITVKDRFEDLAKVSFEVEKAVRECGITDFAGPITPSVEKIGREYIRQFWIKFPRNRQLQSAKQALLSKIELIKVNFKNLPTIIVDVDPL